MEKKNIIIVGAGFGGITAALTLEKKLRRLPEYSLILVDKNSYQLYTPALYEIASVPAEETTAYTLKSAVAIPIEDIIAPRSIKFIQGELAGLDKNGRLIFLKDGRSLRYQFLILALGSETNYFGIPGLKEQGHALKKVEDAIRIRNSLERLLKENRPLSVIVAGAGMSGVELIAEFSNFICFLQKKLLQNHPLCRIKLLLVEAAPEILPGFESWTIQKTKDRFQKLGIEIKTASAITEVLPAEIILKDGSRLAYDLLIWTGGVKGPEILSGFGLPLTTKGNLLVNQFLEAGPGIAAVGDSAGFTDPRTGRALPWNAALAKNEAGLVAENIIREIRSLAKKPFHPGEKYPYIIALGKKYAIADLVLIRWNGLWGWIAKLLAELYYLLSVLPFWKAVKHWIRAVRVYVSND